MFYVQDHDYSRGPFATRKEAEADLDLTHPTGEWVVECDPGEIARCVRCDRMLGANWSLTCTACWADIGPQLDQIDTPCP